MKPDRWDWVLFVGLIVFAAGLYLQFGSGIAILSIGASLTIVGMIGAMTQAES